MSKNKFFTRSLTTLAVITALGGSFVAQASNTDGGLRVLVVDSASKPVVGATVTVRNLATGAVKNATVSEAGVVRVSNLPVGEYELIAEKPGFEPAKLGQVRVRIGDDTGVTLGMNQAGVERIAVTGQAISAIDVTSSESALNISAVELARIPVPRDVTSVALLAPGVTKGDSRFNKGSTASFGGASAAENSMFINGLNVTNFRNGLGFSSVPYEFYKEFQVKTGGYSAEFGRSTGGVINAVTKSGSNEFEAGASVYWKPKSLRETSPNVFRQNGEMYRYNSEREADEKNYNIYVGGAAIQDTLFYYLMFNPRKINDTYNGTTGETQHQETSDDSFWGGKIDWQITDGHLVELLAFSDSNDIVTDNYGYNFRTGQLGGYTATETEETGGDNWSVTYTGHITDNFTSRVMYGENEYALTTLNNVLQDCALVIDNRKDKQGGKSQPGCTTTSAYQSEEGADKREALRLDFDWTLDEHVLRFGLDNEVNSSYSKQAYSGPAGRYYQIYDTSAGTKLSNGAVVPAGVNAYVRSRFRTVSGNFETEANAFYIEDTWSVTDDVTLTLGLRNESFENKNSEGNTFVKVDNMWAPRLGIAWDPTGTGESKVYANVGRYHLPVANNTNVRLSGNELDYYTFNVFGGFEDKTFNGNPYKTPIEGAQIGDLQYNADGDVPDVSSIVDQDLDAMYQDELLIGYQSSIDDNWNWGVRGIQRKMNGAIDDLIIDHWLKANYGCEPHQYVLGNPGEDMTVAVDSNCDGDVDKTVTIPGSELVYPKAVRTYYSIQMNLDRTWDATWMASFSYTWAHSYGNSEGLVKSDNAQDDAGITQDFDFPALMDGAYGNLPNDRRHAFKIYGAYALNDMVRLGANFRLESGRPTNAFGISHPDGRPDYGDTYYVCTSACESAKPVFHQFTRGSYGSTPWTAQLDLSATLTTTIANSEVEFRADIFNVLNASGVTRVDEYAELGDQGKPSPTFNLTQSFQAPRSVQLSASVKF